jgi:carbon monoxide dehydrogenase subunit G
VQIEGEYTFNAPREVVYDLLQDPTALEKAMPGATTLTRVTDELFEASVVVKVGAIGGTFGGTVSVQEADRPRHFMLVVEGKGGAGFLKGAGTIDLEEGEGDTTLIKYKGETQVGGKIAQVGQRLIQTVARKMIGEGLKSLETQLSEQGTSVNGSEQQ